MASLRGGESIWANAALLVNAVSAPIVVGPGPFVAIYLTSDTALTFKVQVSATAAPKAGRNAVSDISGAPDYGLTWFDYTSKEGHAVSASVTAGASVCLDLAQFSPEILRLVITTLTGTAHVTALASGFGAN